MTFQTGKSRMSRGSLIAPLLLVFGTVFASTADAALFGNRGVPVENPSFPPHGNPASAQMRTISVGGMSRSYLIQPASGASAAPIVVMLHGGTQTAAQVWTETSLPVIAQQKGFIVVAPDGLNKHWNDGRGAVLGGQGSSADDVAFLRAVIQQVVQQNHGNANAVFMFGPSNGGFMVQHFACEAGEMLHAAANLISDLPTSFLQSCKSGKPLPWLSINGTADPLIPFAGQAGTVMQNNEPQPPMLSAEQTFKFWADRAKCSPQATTQRIGGTDAAHFTEKRIRSGCAGGAQSIEYVVYGAGHTMPGTPVKSLLFRRIIGDGSTDVDTGTELWNFFQSTLGGG